MILDNFVKRRSENRFLEVLLKIFLVIGIVAGLCIILKFIYDKFFRDNFCYCEGDDDYDYYNDDGGSCSECTFDDEDTADSNTTETNTGDQNDAQ